MILSNFKFDFIKITISRIINLVINMISIMLLARQLTLQDYGTYSQILLVVGLSNTLIVLGLPNSINYFLSSSENIYDKKIFLSTYYTLSTVLGVISGVLLIITIPLIQSYFGNPNLKFYIFALFLLPWTQITISSLDSVLVINKRTNWLIVFQLSRSIFIVLAVFLAMFYKLNLLQYMKISLSVEVLFSFIVYFLASKTVNKLKFVIHKPILVKIVKYSIPIGISGIVGTVSLYLDKLIIGKLMSTEYVALYANAGRELPIAIITSSLITVLLPRFITLFKEGKKEKAIEIWSKSLTLSFALMCFFATYLIVFAPQLLTFLYSSKYLPAVGIFRIYSAILITRCTYFGMGLSAIGKTKYIMYISIFALILNFLLNYIFFGMFGFEGPALATVVSTIITAMIYTILNSKILKVKIRNLISIQELLKILIVNVILGFIIYKYFGDISLDLDISILIIFIFISLIWFTLYLFVLRNIFIKNKDFLD